MSTTTAHADRITALIKKIDPYHEVGTGALSEALSESGVFPFGLVDDVAQFMRRIDGNHTMSAEDLGDALAGYLFPSL